VTSFLPPFYSLPFNLLEKPQLTRLMAGGFQRPSAPAFAGPVFTSSPRSRPVAKSCRTKFERAIEAIMYRIAPPLFILFNSHKYFPSGEYVMKIGWIRYFFVEKSVFQRSES